MKPGFPYLIESRPINCHPDALDPTRAICNNCNYSFDALDSAIWSCPSCGMPVKEEA